jgi:hypothetical protein
MANGKSNPKDLVYSKLKEYLSDDIHVFIYANTEAEIEGIDVIDLSQLLKKGYFYRPKITKDYSTKLLAIAMGIQTPFKAIEMDIVAAQFYNDILDGHKDTADRMLRIRDYLDRELRIISGFIFGL